MILEGLKGEGASKQRNGLMSVLFVWSYLLGRLEGQGIIHSFVCTYCASSSTCALQFKELRIAK